MTLLRGNCDNGTSIPSVLCLVASFLGGHTRFPRFLPFAHMPLLLSPPRRGQGLPIFTTCAFAYLVKPCFLFWNFQEACGLWCRRGGGGGGCVGSSRRARLVQASKPPICTYHDQAGARAHTAPDKDPHEDLVEGRLKHEVRVVPIPAHVAAVRRCVWLVGREEREHEGKGSTLRRGKTTTPQPRPRPD